MAFSIDVTLSEQVGDEMSLALAYEGQDLQNTYKKSSDFTFQFKKQ